MQRFRQLQRLWLAKFLALEDPVQAYVDIISTYQRIEPEEIDRPTAGRIVNQWIRDEWVQRQIEQFNQEMFAGSMATKEQLLDRLEKLTREARLDADKIKAIKALGEAQFGLWKAEQPQQQGFSLVEILRELNGDTSVRIATTERVDGGALEAGN